MLVNRRESRVVLLPCVSIIESLRVGGGKFGGDKHHARMGTSRHLQRPQAGRNTGLRSQEGEKVIETERRRLYRTNSRKL